MRLNLSRVILPWCVSVMGGLGFKVTLAQFGDGEDAWEDEDFDGTEDSQCRNQ